MKIHRLVALGTLLLSPVLALASTAPDTNGSGTTLTVAAPTQVPGKTLKAGTYKIRVVDHLSDRMIIQVSGPGGPQTFLALPKSGLPSGSQGPITLNSNGKQALRGFAFPDGTVAEFVYPKAEAVSLAKANDTTIPAVDPASEGRPADPNLSRSDMEMVTLWMLTPKPVGPGESGPGIAAAKYQEPVQTASVSTSTAHAASAPKPRAARPAPLMAALPHTASEAPALALFGVLSLCGAGLLTFRRRAAQTV